MVSIFGWLRQNKSEDYAQVLEKLALDVQKRETRLSEIRLRERRSTLLFSVYAVAFWAVWTGLWYAELLPNLSGHSRNSGFERTVKAIPVFAGPVVILFIRRIVQIWYTRTADAEEKALTALRKQRHEKVEEFKKKTNYYSTRSLIERYDDAGPPDSPLRRRMPQGVSATPQRGPQPSPQTPAPMPLSSNLQQQLSPPPQRPMPPPRKQWFDKLADAILGDDDGASVNAASSRYALICQKCFAHNGLVKESMWEDAQYVCPKCGHFNPSARSMRQVRAASKSKSPDSRVPPPQMSPVQQPGQPHAFAPPVGMPVGLAGPTRGSSSPTLDNVSSRQRTRVEGYDTGAPEADASVMDIDS